MHFKSNSWELFNYVLYNLEIIHVSILPQVILSFLREVSKELRPEFLQYLSCGMRAELGLDVVKTTWAQTEKPAFDRLTLYISLHGTLYNK